MNELIKITEHNGKKAVSARELHNFVDMLTRFDIWIMRMLEYGFTENVDYQCLYKNVPMPNGGFKQAIDDYALSIECAKEISMLQRNDKGKQARLYFIDCEKQLMQPKYQLPKSFSEALQLAADQAKQLELQSAQIKELEPKAEVYDNIANADNNISLNEAAKSIGIGRNLMMQRMRATKILLANNTPPQHLLNAGYFVVKITNLDHLGRNQPTTFVTPKGLIWLSKTINQN